MGKAAKQAANLKKAQEMAAIAQDLSDLKDRHFIVVGIQIDPVTVRTQFGPVQGCTLIFHMKDGTQREPVILDPVGSIQAIAGISATLVGQGRPAPEPPAGQCTEPDCWRCRQQTAVDGEPHDTPEVGSEPPHPDTARTASGLFLPS